MIPLRLLRRQFHRDRNPSNCYTWERTKKGVCVCVGNCVETRGGMALPEILGSAD